VGIGIGSAILVIVGVLPFAARLRRRLRYRRAGTAAEQVTARYLDFLDWCSAVRLGRAAGETPIQHARRLAEASSNSDDSLHELARLATRAAYAPPNGHDPDAAQRLGLRATHLVSPGVSRRQRALARVGWGWWRGASLRREKRTPARIG
jgi:hypothetical protein